MNREAQILQALANRSLSMEARRALTDELYDVRAEAARRHEASRSIDFDAASAHLTPVQPYVPHTAETDWLGRVAAHGKTAQQIHAAAKAEASRWFTTIHPQIVADRTEFAIQATGKAHQWAGQWGDDFRSAVASFLQQAGHLAGFKVAECSDDDSGEDGEDGDSNGDAEKSDPPMSGEDGEVEDDDDYDGPRKESSRRQARLVNVWDLKPGDVLLRGEGATPDPENDTVEKVDGVSGMWIIDFTNGQSTPPLGNGQVYVASRRSRLAADGQTCSVCGDKIAQTDGSWHHDNGEKHDHEAKPGGGDSKESSRRTAVSQDVAAASAFLGKLNEGDPVIVVIDGQEHQMAVSRRLSRGDPGGYGAMESSYVIVSFGPGRYSTDITVRQQASKSPGMPYIKDGTTASLRVGYTNSYGLNDEGPTGMRRGDRVWIEGAVRATVLYVGFDDINNNLGINPEELGFKMYQDSYPVAVTTGDGVRIVQFDALSPRAVTASKRVASGGAPSGETDDAAQTSQTPSTEEYTDESDFDVADDFDEGRYGSHTASVGQIVRDSGWSAPLKTLEGESQPRTRSMSVDALGKGGGNLLITLTFNWPTYEVRVDPYPGKVVAKGETGSLGIIEMAALDWIKKNVTPEWYMAEKEKAMASVAGLRRRASDVPSPSPESQNGYGESSLPDVTVSGAPEDTNLGWIDDDPEGAYDQAPQGSVGPFDAAVRTAADGATSFCRLCGKKLEQQDNIWYALSASREQRDVGQHYCVPARLTAGRPGEFGPDGVLVPGTPGGEGGQYDAPAGTIFDGGGNPIKIARTAADREWKAEDWMDYPDKSRSEGTRPSNVRPHPFGMSDDEVAEFFGAPPKESSIITNTAGEQFRIVGGSLVRVGEEMIVGPSDAPEDTNLGWIAEGDPDAQDEFAFEAPDFPIANEAALHVGQLRIEEEVGYASGNPVFVVQYMPDNEDSWSYGVWENVKTFVSRDDAERYIADHKARFPKDSSLHQAMPNPVDLGIQVGDIFYSSWGYDQTNVDFYQVVGLTGASVKVRQIAQRTVRSGGAGGDSVVAVPDHFVGEVMTKRIQNYRDVPTFTLNSYSDASLWDGTPKYQTGFGFGH